MTGTYSHKAIAVQGSSPTKWVRVGDFMGNSVVEQIAEWQRHDPGGSDHGTPDYGRTQLPDPSEGDEEIIGF